MDFDVHILQFDLNGKKAVSIALSNPMVSFQIPINDDIASDLRDKTRTDVRIGSGSDRVVLYYTTQSLYISYGKTFADVHLNVKTYDALLSALVTTANILSS